MTVHQYDIVLDVTVINRTDATMQVGRCTTCLHSCASCCAGLPTRWVRLSVSGSWYELLVTRFRATWKRAKVTLPHKLASLIVVQPRRDWTCIARHIIAMASPGIQSGDGGLSATVRRGRICMV